LPVYCFWKLFDLQGVEFMGQCEEGHEFELSNEYLDEYEINKSLAAFGEDKYTLTLYVRWKDERKKLWMEFKLA
jgi:hypothetical protein